MADTRDKERTRAALLASAHELFFEQGSGVSLAKIAEHAGVSKGALLHHFPSRAELERPTEEATAVAFRERVLAHVDETETAPGKIVRAYIRALTSDAPMQLEFFSPRAMVGALSISDARSSVIFEDAQISREAIVADGFDRDLALVLCAAAEGLAMNVGSPYLTDEEMSAASAKLLELAGDQPAGS